MFINELLHATQSVSLHSYSIPTTIGVSADFDLVLDNNVGLSTIIISSLMYADCEKLIAGH